VSIYCNFFGQQQIVQAYIYDDAPTSPVAQNDACVCLAISTWQVTESITDPCHLSNHFCDFLIDGVELTVARAVNCWDEGACTDAFMASGGDPLAITVRRVLP